LASDLQIDFYQDNNSQKTLIEQINQSWCSNYKKQFLYLFCQFY
jgi:hypothetical protein